ncbi:hypothetical protein GCM10027590_57730 [Nocardiopsis nanhaiensis]
MSELLEEVDFPRRVPEQVAACRAEGPKLRYDPVEQTLSADAEGEGGKTKDPRTQGPGIQ